MEVTVEVIIGSSKLVSFYIFSNFLERFCGSFEVFAASFLKAVNAQFSRSFDNFYVFFPDWKVSTFLIINWLHQKLFQLFLLHFGEVFFNILRINKIFFILLDDETKVFDLPFILSSSCDSLLNKFI